MGTPDFNVPLLTATEAGYAAALLDLFRGLALGLDTSANNPPTGAIRWNSANGRWEKFDGTSWGALASRYFIDVDTLDGLHANDLALAGHNHSGTYQPLASVLTLLGGLTPAADTIGYFAGPSAAARTAFTALARTLLGCTDTANMRATLGLVIGTNVQAQDATLAALAALTTAADKLIYATGSDAFATCDFPAAARTLLAATTVALQRTALGLGSAATRTAGVAAGNVPVLDASGKLASALIPGGVGGVDTLARDNAAMNAFVSWLAAGRASGPVPGGYLWTFQTDEWNKTDAYYDADGDYYHNGGTSVDVGNEVVARSVDFGGNSTGLDLNFSLPAGQLVSAKMYTASAGVVCKFKVFRLVSGTTYSYVGESQQFTTVAGVNTVTFATPITVQAGDRLGVYHPSTLGGCLLSGGSMMNYGGDATSQQTFSALSHTFSISGSVQNPVTNMTIYNPSVSLGYVPAKATVYILHRAVDAVTLNTDIKVGASRVSGWAYATDLVDLGAYSASYKLLRATVDLSALASGTSGYARVETADLKRQLVRAALAWFE